ncbi:hypothetical protein D3C85_748290 [compost metagenome]
MVAAAGHIGVEVARRHPLVDQVHARGRVGRDLTAGRNVVCGQGIAKRRQHAPVRQAGRQVGQRVAAGFGLEERRFDQVLRIRVPRKAQADGRGQVSPDRAVQAGGVIDFGKQRRVRSKRQQGCDLVLAGPDIAQIDWRAVRARPQRLALEVHVDAARQRIQHHHRGRPDVIGA